nr:hypothetical protein [Candidatus Accumulibacter sp. ACC003]
MLPVTSQASRSAIALDCASSELFDEGGPPRVTSLEVESDKLFTDDEMIEVYDNWCKKYPIVSIEDGLDPERLGRLRQADQGARRNGADCPATTSSSQPGAPQAGYRHESATPI